MFTTIQVSKNESPTQRSPKPPRKVTSSRGIPVLACTECRRRKTRCDGEQPCQRCKDFAKDAPCIYVASKPRTISSHNIVEQSSSSLQQCRSILSVLFPSTDPSALCSLSRQELVELLQGIIPPGTENRASSAPQLASDAGLVLEQLQDTLSEFDEDNSDFVTDDVNALSLSALRHSSYVGSSSISAALKVISFLSPSIPKHSSLAHIDSSYEKTRIRNDFERPSLVVPRETEAALVEAYFAHVHVLIPMIDEHHFRTHFCAGTRDDGPWLSLMNMVFALGSIAASTCIDTMHTVFYQRAKQCLGFEAFGSGRIETIQALALMGGFYLHYCNRPNMAVALTGAALRMACALGIHRESSLCVSNEHSRKMSFQNDREIKRRTWWSLVCLDVWGSTTLGRPSACQYFGPAITVQPPQFDNTEMLAFADQGPYLIASVQFCRLAAQIQDRLAISSYLDPAEIAIFDKKLVGWFESLPSPLRSPYNCVRTLLIPRAILKWRYQNLRLLLHRPVLLLAALSRRNLLELLPAEQDAIKSCQSIAGDTIIDIATDWQPDHICGWNAVWFLFQASIVPLLSLFYESDNVTESGKWRGQIEMALRVLQAMELWSAVAKRSREVLSEVYEASSQISQNIWEAAIPQWDGLSPCGPNDGWNSTIWDQVSQFPEFPFGPTDFGDIASGS